MDKLLPQKVLPYVVALSILLSGCGEKSECEIPTRHVHKYIKEITPKIKIERYMDDEHLNVFGYKWNNEYIEINKVDEKVYDLLRNYGLFEGKNSWEYLYNEMATHHDYLEFYYEYTTTEIIETTDAEGNIIIEEEKTHHEGWHQNPYFSENTGRTRLYHHRYYGYKIVYEDGRFRAIKSPAVDDVRDVINEYPYFSEDCVTLVHEEFRFRKSELKYLSPEDFDVYKGPDLANKNLESEQKVKGIN